MVRNAQVEMYYNEDFLKTLTDKEGVAVVTHECLHIVMDHINRMEERKAMTQIGTLWNVATDLAINQLIINLPKCALRVGVIPFDKLQLDRSAEEYYDALLQDQKNMQQISMQGNGDHSKWMESDNTAVDAIPEIVKEAVRRSQGSIPSNVSKYVEQVTRTRKIAWDKVLRQWIAQSIKVGHKFSWKRPSKRFGEIQKGKICKRDIKIAVAVDTSGSIDDGMYKRFIGELNNLRTTYKAQLTLIQCDAKVQKVWSLTPHQTIPLEIHGRGGTDFRPVFDYLKEKKLNPDVLIYLTDMWGEFPSSSNVKTLWVSWSSETRAPFGRVVQIEED
jgi:predicted metal-dependent peptidase